MCNNLQIAINIIIYYSLNYYLCVPCFRKAAAENVLFIGFASFLHWSQLRHVALFCYIVESWDAGIRSVFRPFLIT